MVNWLRWIGRVERENIDVKMGRIRVEINRVRYWPKKKWTKVDWKKSRSCGRDRKTIKKDVGVTDPKCV